MARKIENLVWIDLEMTGLDPLVHKIIQIAVVVTDTNLNMLEEGFVAILGIEKEDVKRMEEIVKEMHTKNGLLELALKSKITIEQADKLAVEYISQFVKPKESPLCGSSVYMDRIFMNFHMPLLYDYLHYRNIDVSSIAQTCSLWKEKAKYPRPSSNMHEALSDIKESINELKHYKKELFD